MAQEFERAESVIKESFGSFGVSFAETRYSKDEFFQRSCLKNSQRK